MARRPGDDRRRRLADVRVPDARRPAVLRRHLLPGRAAPRHAVVPPGARGRRPGLARAARPRSRPPAARLVAGARRAGRGSRRGAADPTPELLDAADGRASRPRSTPANGGWGGAPKFPQPMTHRVPAPPARRDRRSAAARDRAPDARRDGRRRASTTSSAAASTATRPTRAGSCRTSSRCSTTTPSSRASTSTPGRSTGDARYRDVATGTLDYMLRELTTDDGAFAASQDADTDGVEGLTFTWRAAEIREVLGDDAPLFAAAYGVTDDGNWEGVDDPVAGLRRRRRRAAVPATAEVEARARRRARAACSRAAADAAAAGPRRQGAGGLERAGDRGVRRGRRGCSASPTRAPVRDGRRARRGRRSSTGCSAADGALGRSWKDGRAVGEGVLEDYAAPRRRPAGAVRGDVRRALVHDRARPRGRDPGPLRRPGRRLLRHRRRPRAARHPPKDVQDNAVPSGGAMAATRPAAAGGADRRGPLPRRRGAGARARSRRSSARYPTGLRAVARARSTSRSRRSTRSRSSASPDDPATRGAAREVAADGYRPNQVVAVAGRPGAPSRRPAARRPRRDRRPADGLRLPRLRLPAAGHRPGGAARAARGVRRDRVTDAPVTDVDRSSRGPAATVVLLRPGPAGLEVLLTQRPATMAFAPDMHVFPGGRVDAADADPRLVARGPSCRRSEAADALGGDLEPEPRWPRTSRRSARCSRRPACCWPTRDAPRRRPSWRARDRRCSAGDDDLRRRSPTALDLRLRTDLLVAAVALGDAADPAAPVRRAVLRRGAARRARRSTFEGDEVVGARLATPARRARGDGRGRLAMWLPTSATLQQLEHARVARRDPRRGWRPGRLGAIVVEELSPRRHPDRDAGRWRRRRPAGQRVSRRAAPVRAVDPGDPTGPALDRALRGRGARGGAIVAIALTHVDPDHAAGAEALAEMLGDPGPRRSGRRPAAAVRGPRARRRRAPSTGGDVAAPGRSRRPGRGRTTSRSSSGDGQFVLAGDLDGSAGARSILGPPDEAALDGVASSASAGVAPDATSARRPPGRPSARRLRTVARAATLPGSGGS